MQRERESNPSRLEVVLLRRLTQVDLPEEELRAACAALGGAARWDALVRLAVAHGVVPLVHHNLRRLDFEPVPQAAFRQLRGFVRAHLRRSLLLSRTLPGLLERFAARGIEAVPFKGPVLAAMAYRDEALRSYTDLDLLVRESEVGAAVALLEEMGFEAVHPLRPDRAARWATYWPLQDPHGNANGYVRGKGTPGELAVDLHWGLASRYFLFPLDPEELWERLAPVALGTGHAVHTFSPEDTLLYLCVHAAKHDWARLVYVCDVAALIEAHPAMDWGWLLEKAHALRGERMLLLGVHLADRWYRIPVPEHVRQRAALPDVSALARQAEHLLFEPPGVGRSLQAGIFHLRVRDRARDGLGAFVYHLRLALQPTEKDRAWVTLPPSLSFAHYLLRPVRVLYEALTAPLTEKTAKGEAKDSTKNKPFSP